MPLSNITAFIYVNRSGSSFFVDMIRTVFCVVWPHCWAVINYSCCYTHVTFSCFTAKLEKLKRETDNPVIHQAMGSISAVLLRHLMFIRIYMKKKKNSLQIFFLCEEIKNGIRMPKIKVVTILILNNPSNTSRRSTGMQSKQITVGRKENRLVFL